MTGDDAKIGIIEEIKSLLADAGPDLMGSVAAELMANWLSGYVVAGDPAATATARKKMLEFNCEHIWELVALYDAIEPP